MEARQLSIHRDIVEQCLAGDRQAQFELYKLYEKAMYNICYRMTNDKQEAEDILQEAFVSVFKYMASYKGSATIGAWIKRIVINTGINHLKKQRLQLVPLEHANQQVVEETNIDWEGIALKVGTVKDAMMKLPDGYRLVFSLYSLEGYDHKEVAEILGITESTSKSQYNRAKNKIRKILLEEV